MDVQKHTQKSNCSDFSSLGVSENGAIINIHFS